MYLTEPYSKFAQMQQLNEFKRGNELAKGMPGYEQLSQIASGVGGNSYNNTAEFSKQMNPLDFLKNMGMTETGVGGTEQLIDFGEGAYELFDQFVPGMQQLAETQGVSGDELANMLAESSAGYKGNIANQNMQTSRAMGRMGINPASGNYQAMQGSRDLQEAAGLSGLQQSVRRDASDQDWQQRLQAAGIGLNLGSQGTDALSKASSSLNTSAGIMGDAYGDYMSGYGQMRGLDENARQFDAGQKMQAAQGLTGAVPAYQNTFYGNYAPKATWDRSGGSRLSINAPHAAGDVRTQR